MKCQKLGNKRMASPNARKERVSRRGKFMGSDVARRAHKRRIYHSFDH